MSNTSAPASVAVTQERKVVTAIPGPKSQEMHKRRAEVIPPGVSAALPVYIENAYGSIVQDVDGNQFIDFATGIGVTTIGHANDAVVAAVAEAASHFTHVCFTVTPYEGYVKVAANPTAAMVAMAYSAVAEPSTLYRRVNACLTC